MTALILKGNNRAAVIYDKRFIVDTIAYLKFFSVEYGL